MLREILLPRTDAGVYAQAAVVFPALGIALLVVRQDRDLRTFVLGLAVMTLALFGVRALH